MVTEKLFFLATFNCNGLHGYTLAECIYFVKT
jgi:hypothetical protein